METSEEKARVMAKMEAAVDRALAKGEQGGNLTLSEIEELVLSVGAELSEALTEELVEGRSEELVPGPLCSGCGKEMHYKGKKRRYIRTRTGDIRLERAYYYCEDCQRGFFPPG